MDLSSFLIYVISGAAVGLMVGATGVGGGSLMTPLLLLLGIPVPVAVGTDLLYATISKSGAMISHGLRRSIEWRVVGLMASGSIPGALLTLLVLSQIGDSGTIISSVLNHALGVMLILTALAIWYRNRLQNRMRSTQESTPVYRTVLIGLFMGIMVTLSSVGAGAFATAALLLLFPGLAAARVVGTDVAHAVPLTLIAGLGHLALGHVDLMLLLALVIGALPAVNLGARIAHRLSDNTLRGVLGFLLMTLGVRFALF